MTSPSLASAEPVVGSRRSTLAILCVALSAGALWSGPVFRISVAHELGWSQQSVAGAFAIGSLAGIPVALLAGMAADRWGPVRVLVGGSLLTALGLLGASLITDLWQWYFAIVALALGFKSVSSGASLIASISARRGRSLGTVFGALGLGLTLGPPVMQALIDLVGWRWALALEGAVLVALAASATSLSDHAAVAAPRPPAPRRSPEAEDRRSSTSKPVLSPPLLLIGFFVGNVLIGIYDESVYQHAYAYGKSLGLSGAAAAGVIGLVSAAYVGGSVGGGLLSDLLGRRAVSVAAALLSAVSLLGMAASSAELLWLWGVLFGVALGTTLVARSAAWADAFAGPALGRNIGLVTPGFSVGAAIITYAGAAWVDAGGMFQLVYVGAAAAAMGWALVGGALMRPHPRPEAVAGPRAPHLSS